MTTDSCITQLVLPEELTIYTAQLTKSRLLDCLKTNPSSVEIDLADIKALDSAGIQLLMQFKAEAQQRGFSLHLRRHSQAVVNAFELLKLSSYFGDPLVIPAER